MKQEFPCLEVNQPIGTFYIASIKASLLKKFCFSRVASYEAGSIDGHQRKINESRTNEIRRYLETPDATIPNTIILSANYREDDSLVVDGAERWEYSNGKLIVPEDSLKICSIIDGQHRLQGFTDLDLDMDIPCSIFIDLPPSMQAYVFSTINFNQKKVDKSLAYQLFGYQMDESDSDLWSPDILAVKISRIFHADGPFKNKIRIMGSNSNSDDWSISSASFIEGVLSLITGNAKNDKYQISKKGIIGYPGRKVLKENSNYPLRKYYLSGNDKAIVMVLDRYFSSLQKTLWKSQPCNSIVFKTVGISAQFRFLKYLLTDQIVKLDKELNFDSILSPLSLLDFSQEEDLFSARTATTKLLVDTFKVTCGEKIKIDESKIDQRVLGFSREAKRLS